ncbi:MAG: hypothetical protein ABIK97_03520 [candidate division WOR-3 bacterium]
MYENIKSRINQKRGNGELSFSDKLLAAPSQRREKNTPLVPKGYF